MNNYFNIKPTILVLSLFSTFLVMVSGSANASSCTGITNDESSGVFNVACGNGNFAGGTLGGVTPTDNNVALGNANYARNGQAVAVGTTNYAEAVNATAVGSSNRVYGNDASAFGTNNFVGTFLVAV